MFVFLDIIIASFLLMLCGGQIRLPGRGEGCEGCKAYECIEGLKQCGPDGYPLGYGLKYCNRFTERDVYDRYDEAGKNFIRCTKDCLIQKLEDKALHGSSESCDALKEFAFNSHVDCYTGCGFCDICKTNKAALLHTYDLGDFFSTQALQQVYTVAQKCGVFACF